MIAVLEEKYIDTHKKSTQTALEDKPLELFVERIWSLWIWNRDGLAQLEEVLSHSPFTGYSFVVE